MRDIKIGADWHHRLTGRKVTVIARDRWQVTYQSVGGPMRYLSPLMFRLTYR